MKPVLLRKADIFAAVAVAVICAVAFLIINTGGNGTVAVIEYGGETVRTVSLSSAKDTYSFTVEGDIPVEITVSGDGICISDSGCRDKTCVKFGVLKHRGDIAVCLPARVSVRITGGEVDAVTG